MRLTIAALLVLLAVISHVHAQPACEAMCDIYIVLTCSDTMVELPQLMGGARAGLQSWLRGSTRGAAGCGPRVSLCCYGTRAEEQIQPGDPLDASGVTMTGGISRLDLGIECARLSSQANRRPNACQCMALIVSEDPLGFGADDFTEDARAQLALARSEGFCRITLTTVTDNVFVPYIQDFPDDGYLLEITLDFNEFARRAALTTRDSDLWNQFRCCPEVTTTTIRPTPPSMPGLCNDCIIREGIGYNFFDGDCRRFVQCFFDNRVPPFLVKWTSPGTFWDRPQVQQHWPKDVICEWDPCTIGGVGLSAYGDDRYCAAYWQCALINGTWRTEKLFCCPDPINEVWDDNTKECRAITNGPGCEDPCPFLRPTPDPLCNHDVRVDPRFYFDVRDPDAEDRACDLGMVFDVGVCTCIGIPDPTCIPVLDVDFDGGVIEDKSPNRFWIGNNGGVVAAQTPSGEWYGAFDGSSELFVPGLSNLDLMENWAFVVRYDAEGNTNSRAALIGSTNCAKLQGSYHLALVPQNGQLEAYVKTDSGGVTKSGTATITVPTNGIVDATYVYHTATGLSVCANGDTDNFDIDGTMWRDESLCGFHIGWGQLLDYFEGRIYEVRVYRDPDCIPPSVVC